MYLKNVSYVATFCPLANSMGYNFNLYSAFEMITFIWIYRKNYLSVYILKGKTNALYCKFRSGKKMAEIWSEI